MYERNPYCTYNLKRIINVLEKNKLGRHYKGNRAFYFLERSPYDFCRYFSIIFTQADMVFPLLTPIEKLV